MTFYYCYDAHCGWCYGFSKSVTQFQEQYGSRFHFEVLSGGMIPKEFARPIKATARFILEEHTRVEELSGALFGPDFLWHIQNPDDSDWFPESLTPAIALCVFKDFVPQQQVQVAADIQKAQFAEGRDLSDGEAYRHLLAKYHIPEEAFFQKLKDPAYEEQARYEFALCKQLQVTAFPKLLLQVSDTKFYLVSEGYTPLATLSERVANIIKEMMAGKVENNKPE
ncbi:MAG TPA: DsbA family protein [Niabella sp.]|nr:DsbA family protein [Niabella sp.]HOZ98254.1 DsbA family protein [Niabella sp.]HQW13186.1 DsbA family protein [Niabella sp.]HQX18774.1 DsbA family protein [Niabella sp.]HQX41164.1 DsbA family protein [Niabella sp.]